MAGLLSQPPPDASTTRIQDLEYLYASNANVSNFLSVKLSGNSNYNVWEAQMICLMESHNMHGIVDSDSVGPRYSNKEIDRQYEYLLKGWIFSSISEHLLVSVINIRSVKDVWDKLKSLCHPAAKISQPADSRETKKYKHKGKFQKAWDDMLFGTCKKLLQDGKCLEEVEIGHLLMAISLKQYELAIELLKANPRNVDIHTSNRMSLEAIATTFPSGLLYLETLIYPSSFDKIQEMIVKEVKSLLRSAPSFYKDGLANSGDNVFSRLILVLKVPFVLIYHLLRFLIANFYYLFLVVYRLMWEAGASLVAPINHIETKYKEWEEAKKLLTNICDKIDKSDHPTDHDLYKKPILEAARNNAYDVVDEILSRNREAIRCVDDEGHDIIQLAIINRSEKIYNLVHHTGGYKSPYRMLEDSSKNNMLHLAGLLAPSSKLKRRTGAVLQLQQELQWREEMKKLVCPTVTTKENNFKETPDMLFTREHESLVKEGEEWMKTTAESCSITAALIITIVFAAAITVPGGNNEKGTPLFTKDIAFTIFAISDAISLFTSSTSLLVFLSVLTARFAEQDFLVSLPRRLIIGLCTLFISTTAMMVAFGATLFLVFCRQKPWMLAPLCGLAFLPIVVFVSLQFPLIADLISSTNVKTFGKISKSDHLKFDPDNLESEFAS